MRYSVQPRDRTFVKGYGILSFYKMMGKIIGKNISKTLNGKQSQKIIDYAKQSVTYAFKTASKKAIRKTTEATGDLIGNKITNKIIKISKTSQQNNSETVTNEHDNEIPKKRYIQKKDRKLLMI